MSSSSQHDNASRERKRSASEDSEDEGVDDVTKRIRGLDRILEEPDTNRISDDVLLFYAINATDFIDALKTLVCHSESSKPEDLLNDVRIDRFGRLFIKRFGESVSNYREEFEKVASNIYTRRYVLQAIKPLLDQVSKLPGIGSSISNVWDLLSFIHTAVDKKLQDVDFHKFDELCIAAHQQLEQKISDAERMIEFIQELDIVDAWTADKLKSTSAFELLQLRPKDVKELEELLNEGTLYGSVAKISDFLNEKLKPFKELPDLISSLQGEVIYY